MLWHWRGNSPVLCNRPTPKSGALAACKRDKVFFADSARRIVGIDSNVGGGITWFVQPVGAVQACSMPKGADRALSARSNPSQSPDIRFEIDFAFAQSRLMMCAGN